MHANKPSSPLRSVLSVASGNFLEMFDFMIFGYYASAIAQTFFPSDHPFNSLMLSLMTFGAGFLMRPIGAVVLGAYTDRHGRRKGLIVTLALMAVGTLLLACLPGYHYLGLAAPLLVLLGRLLQGFSAGLELGGVSVYLSEIAKPGWKGFYVSWQSASQQVAVMFAATLGVSVSYFLPATAMATWGWRIPLLVGCLIIPVLFHIRRSLPETSTFLARKHTPGLKEVCRTLLDNWRLILVGMLMAMMSTVAFYLITAYTPTFGSTELHLASSDSLLVTLAVGLSNFSWLPVMGRLSDRLGRKPLLLAAAGLFILTAYPVMVWLAAAPSFQRLLAAELWLSFLYATYNGAMIVYLTEIMPAAVKTSAFALSYSLATAIFGGFTPAVCTYLIHLTGNAAMPGVWLSGVAAVALAAIMAAPSVQHNLLRAES